jgi:hypothetical protein
MLAPYAPAIAPVVPAAALPSWPEPTNLTRPGYPPAIATQPITTPPPAIATQPVQPAPADPRAAGDEQRGRGTVYGGTGGSGVADMTIPVPRGNPLENSGSLTGHILAQGWTDTPTPNTGTMKMIGVLIAGLAVLVAIGLLVVFAAGDTFSALFGGLLGR